MIHRVYKDVMVFGKMMALNWNLMNVVYVMVIILYAQIVMEIQMDQLNQMTVMSAQVD